MWLFFKRIKAVLEQYSIEVGVLQKTEDYWCRDYMPLQVAEDRFVKYRYFPNYLDKPNVCGYRTEVEKPWSHLGIDDKFLVDLSDINKTFYDRMLTSFIFSQNRFIENIPTKPHKSIFVHRFCKNASVEVSFR